MLCDQESSCHLAQVIREAVILSHWGLTTPENHCNGYDWVHGWERCRRPQRRPFPAGSLPCHVPDKDVVVPTGGLPDLSDSLVSHVLQHALSGGMWSRSVLARRACGAAGSALIHPDPAELPPPCQWCLTVARCNDTACC